MIVLRRYGQDEHGFFRFASTVRVMRDLTLTNMPAKVSELRKSSKFTETLEALERLAEQGLVQKKGDDDETVQWRAISLLDALAIAADEPDDE